MDKPLLGCKASELTVGTEFSLDEGRTWLVVRTELRYLSEAPDCLTLFFMASPDELPGVVAWEQVNIEDSTHVLLERHWKA